MINVSDKWKENQRKNFVSEGYITISFDISDPEASSDATLSNNGIEEYSRPEEIINQEDLKIQPYTTLEQNIWVLDGSRLVMDTYEDIEKSGYVSSHISKEDCTFDTNPILEIDFSRVHNIVIPAITIDWAEDFGEYAKSFKIYVCKNNALVKTINVDDNRTTTSIVQEDISNYDKIQIEVLKWCLPHHRVRISEVFLGINKKFTKEDLISFSHSQSVDPIGASAPRYEVTFEIDNSNDVFNPNNESGLYDYLARKQEIKVKYGFKIDNSVEYISTGTFYLSEWETPQNGLSASFTARDLLEFMTDNYLLGQHRATPVSFYDLATSVLENANLPKNDDGTDKWEIHDSLRDVYTTAALPICTHAQCLQYIAQASCSVLFYDRRGVLHLAPIDNTITDYEIDQFVAYSHPEINLQKILRKVNVKVYHYYSDKNEELFNGVVRINGTQDVIIQYSDPAINASAIVENGTLNNATYYTNVCVLNITSNGDVNISITGTLLKSSSSNYIVDNEEIGEEQIVDNPLITTTEQALSVANWVKGWLSNRKNISTNYRADPRLDVMDIIKVENKFATDKVRTTSVTFDYDGSFKGAMEGRVIP